MREIARSYNVSHSTISGLPRDQLALSSMTDAAATAASAIVGALYAHLDRTLGLGL
jgi:hypothetical protein